MATILDQIIAHKRAVEVPLLPAVDRAALRDLPACRGFRAALRRPAGQPIRVIAECKKASPSKGVFAPDYDPVVTAFQYVHGGASCLSVLTDEKWFQGRLDDLLKVRAAVTIPIIRKDFTVDARQIAQARLAGADAILLIAACLELGEMRDLHGFARDLGLDVLVEVHDADEALRALRIGADLVGVNNRNLHDFTVSLDRTMELLPGLLGDDRVVVSESGIRDRADCRRLEQAAVDAVLVGETLMLSPDPVAGLHRLRGTVAPAL
ncbi:MAG: indole-3-glycerol phosphate synthase TrpC [Planctomycetes bacterium]|nr:indole-3-glycerol phosphate synthase TrpC [Planctomycetota bacterium]